MTTKKDILENPNFVEFCETRSIKTETIKIYIIALQKYTKLIGKESDELIDEADDEEESGVRLRKRK
jgi:hypothetical protein